MLSHSSRARRWLTRGAVATAGIGIVAGALAPPASAANSSTIPTGSRFDCRVYDDLVAGPLRAGETFGDCRLPAGAFVAGGPGTADSYSLGQVFLPDGASYSAWIDKVW